MKGGGGEPSIKTSARDLKVLDKVKHPLCVRCQVSDVKKKGKKKIKKKNLNKNFLQYSKQEIYWEQSAVQHT